MIWLFTICFNGFPCQYEGQMSHILCVNSWDLFCRVLPITAAEGIHMDSFTLQKSRTSLIIVTTRSLSEWYQCIRHVQCTEVQNLQ